MTRLPKTAIDLMHRGPVIPVVVVDRAVDAVRLAWLTTNDLIVAQGWEAITARAADVIP
jgi:2-keto-3-deoxy-6-phosphogluconate aldolase